MRRLLLLGLLTALIAVGLAAPDALARRPRQPVVVEAPDGDYVHLHLEEDEAAQAWLHAPRDYLPGEAEEAAEDEEATEPARHDLVVALHGAGGVPKNFVMPALMNARSSFCLTVAGHQSVETERGTGFMWDSGNVEYIATFVRHVLEHYPIDAERVIVWGHSAGGTMTLATLAHAPDLFAGGLTTASPATPDSRHREQRVAVLLGTEDPNWGGAPAVRAHAERLRKKRGKGACAFLAIERLGHEVPEDDYLALGFDWVLHGKGRGGEAVVAERARGRSGDYHHILVRHRGAEGAGDQRRSKAAAQKLLKDIRKAYAKGRAFFPFEAACVSEDDDTADGGGGIAEHDLKAFLGEIPPLEAGEVSEILPSAQGFHVVWRPPVEGAEEE